MKKISFIFTLLILGVSFVSTAKAATLNIFSDKDTYTTGQEFDVNVKIDSEGQGINGVQATLQFDKSVLEATKFDKTDSVFDFWLTEPKISNDNGTISFIAAATKGFSGKSLQVIKIAFKLKGSGKSILSFTDAAITAADGSGTNVLSKLNGLDLNFTVPEAVTKGPTQIIRTPEKASGLPAMPVISVSLYPDPKKWSNASSRFFVSWKLPLDVTGVAMVLDKIPSSLPNDSEGLFESKEFPPLKDGIYYIHARYQNLIGWGPTLHYRIAVDTTPPLPFKTEIDNLISDNPTPEISFHIRDALAGILNATISVDKKEILQTTSSTVVLPSIGPGSHVLLIKAFDLAGNSIEDSLKFEITPLPTPVLDFLSKTVSLEDPVFALGRSSPGLFIDVLVLDDSRQEVFKTIVQSDVSGTWKVSIEQSLKTGNYTFSVTARDVRGALSLPTAETSFKVRPQMILSIGGIINLGWFEIFLITVLLIALIISSTAWWYVSKNNTREAYRIIVGRDIEKFSSLLSGNLKELEDVQGLNDTSRLTKASVIIGKMKETITKMKKYIGEEMDKLK